MQKPPPAKTLDIRGLTKTFTVPGGRNVVAVSDFSLRIEPGEFVTFLGPSGCGKTTVLRMLAGLESADAGEILVDGQSIQALPPHRRRVGMVFQNYALFPHMSVFENVAYSLRVRKYPDATRAFRRADGVEGGGARNDGRPSPRSTLGRTAATRRTGTRIGHAAGSAAVR